MCELDQLQQMGRNAGSLNRRQFTAMGAVAGLAACAPMESDGSGSVGLTENMVTFAAPGGTMDGMFVHPASGKYPAVIMWPDIGGLRDAFKAMGRRLASAGYAVFVANPYYRSVAGEQFADFEAFRNDGGFDKVRPWMGANTPEAIMETAKAVVAWLDQQGAVDTGKGVANQGYCMTGSWTVISAAAVPERIKAGASFHGGGLVGDAPTAPSNLLDDVADDARFLFAIAQNDDARAPTDKSALRQAATAAGINAEIEVYPADHGWTVLDSPAYAMDAAERAWGRMLAIYSEAL